MSWWVLALMALGYVAVGIIVVHFVQSVAAAFAAGVISVVLCTYFTLKYRGK